MKTVHMKRRRGVISIILGGIVAAIFYYGAVFLLLEGIKEMPDSPPPVETRDK